MSCKKQTLTSNDQETVRRKPVFTTLSMIFLLLFFALLPLSSFGESTLACHCFKNRSYNPAQKFAADEYILATSFNSLLSNAFVIPKRQIVMLKMKGGVNGNDLLIGLKIAELAKIDLEQLLDLHKQQSWQDLLSKQSLLKNITDDNLLESIKSGIPDEETAQKIGNLLLSDFYIIPLEKIQEFRKSGLNEKEMALLFIMAHTSNIIPVDLAAQHLKNGKSWSEIANNLGIEPVSAGKLILNY